MNGSTEDNLIAINVRRVLKLYWTTTHACNKKVNVLVIKLKDMCDIKKGKCVI